MRDKLAGLIDLARILRGLPPPRLARKFQRRAIVVSPPEGFFFTNPSVAALPDGNLLVSLRVGDNPMNHASFWGRVHYAKGAHTGIELVLLDRDLEELGRRRHVDPFRNRGFLADGRLFLVAGEPWHVGTHQRDDGSVGPSLLAPDGALLPLEVPAQRPGKEKNWTPFAGMAGKFLAQPLPPVICESDLVSGALLKIIQGDPEADRLAHGGSGPLPTGDGWLYFCRQKYAVPRAGLVYVQRAVFLDGDLRLASVSRPFVLDGLGVEILNGAAIAGGRLYLAWGRDDREAHVAWLPLDEALSWLRAMEDPHWQAPRGRAGPLAVLRLGLRLDRLRRAFDRRYG